MGKLFLIILFGLVLLNLVSGKVDEKELNKNLKEGIFENVLNDLGITKDIQNNVNTTDPQVMKNLQDSCQKTESARTLITILTIGSIIGLFVFAPAGIVGFIVDGLVILSYFCWFA